ncbi:MAG: aminopeptidase P family protein [Clostridia bacterium]|nr:aminopeptidase P family protein [Clostridia bacterium]
MNRLDRLRTKMKENGLDALIVSSEINQRYLSRFPFTDGLLLITLAHAELLTDFRYAEDAEKKADPQFEVVTPDDRFPHIRRFFAADGVKQVGYESQTLSCDEFERYKRELPGYSLAGIGDVIEVLREIKDDGELEDIARAQHIADSALAHLLTVIKPEMTEIDVALELEFFMRRSGAEGVAFETIAVSGSASSLPHGRPRNVKLQKGFLTLDFGALYNGYCSDMTRTFSVGSADAGMKKLYNTVLKAQTEALAYLKDGADCTEADRIAREIIDSEPEYKGTFGHSLGHGVGMFIHESPRLSPKYQGKLVTGNVVTVEPGIYLKEKYGCRIEDMVAITPDGIRNFTHSPKELVELF